jgi:hypothetical protein
LVLIDLIAGVATAVGIGVGWIVPPVAVGGTVATIGVAAGFSVATALWIGVKWVYNKIGENTGWW